MADTIENAKLIVEAETKGFEKATADAAKLSGELSKGTANIGQAALEASRGLEDLQYGIGGVLNNIPPLVMRLGGPAGLAAAISLVAVGAKVLYDHWGDLAGLFEARNPFPTVAGSVEALDAALKKTNTELDDLKKKSSLSNEELERANVLIAEQTRLEAEQAGARDIQKIKETKGKEEVARGASFQELLKQFGGPQAGVEREIWCRGRPGPDHGRTDSSQRRCRRGGRAG
jgi:hypothetical protein